MRRQLFPLSIHIKNKPTEYEQTLTTEAREEFVKFARMQILDSKGKSFLTGKSLLQSCLDGQVKCFDFLSRMSSTDVKDYEDRSRSLGFSSSQKVHQDLYLAQKET